MLSHELAEARLSLGLSPTAMARAMGVSYSTYQKWAGDHQRIPAVAARCVEYMLLYPKPAKRLSKLSLSSSWEE